jgi:Family of unknown function (DUF5360)
LLRQTHVIPPYPQEILVVWKWSFLLLDLVASLTGLTALWLTRRGETACRSLMLISLALTNAAGLTALNFWVVRDDCAITWWLPNLWLTLFPVVGTVTLIRQPGQSERAPTLSKSGPSRSSLASD